MKGERYNGKKMPTPRSKPPELQVKQMIALHRIPFYSQSAARSGRINPIVSTINCLVNHGHE